MTTTATKKRAKNMPVTQAAMTKREWKNVVESAYGCLSWMNYSVDEYLREKYAETERDNNS